MRYRIIFSPTIAQWEIELEKRGHFWANWEKVRGETDYLRFATFEEADQYCKKVGLDNVYVRQDARVTTTYQLVPV